MEKKRYSRITDILEIVILMQSKALGVTLSDIQNKFGVSRRTAERLRDSIIDILPVDEIETMEKEKHWGFQRSYLKEIINFTPDEIASLETIKENLKHKNQIEALENVITKLKALNKKQITTIEDRIELLLKSEGVAISQAPNYKTDINALNTIREAINSNRRIEAKYNGNKKLFSPYGIVYGSQIYLIAVENDKKDPYVYLLHKFKDIKMTADTFDKGDFDIKKYTNRSFGVYQNEIIKVELLFDKRIREDVLNFNFHPTQKLKENPDGTVTVKFKASGPLEIIWHLFKWGDEVKIISPKTLKEQYISWLEKCLKKEKEG